MSRLRLSILVVLGLAVASTSAASVRARLAVRPDTLEHCDRGRLAFALWNDGPDTLRVRVHLTLVHDDSVVVRDVALRTRLTPREVRGREGDFTVPPRLPSGTWTIRIAAVASDSSRDTADASFTVLDGGCSTGEPDDTAAATMLAEVVATVGLDQSTPAARQTMGAVKRRWDGSPGK
jgi:hypothetical protein